MRIEKEGLLNGRKFLVTTVREIDLKRVWKQYMDMKPNQGAYPRPKAITV